MYVVFQIDNNRSDSKLLEGFEIKGGVERDGVYFVIKDEKAKEAEIQVKSWLQKIKIAKEVKLQQ